MPDLPAEFWHTGAPWGLVGLFVVALLLGWVRPRRDLTERVADHKARADRAEELVERVLQLDDARTAQMDKLVNANQSVERVLRSVEQLLQARQG